MKKKIKVNELKPFFQHQNVFQKHPGFQEKIKEVFDADAEICFIQAPGRINLIGEHTDYNMGPVLPAAIDREIIIAFSPIADSVVRVHSTQPDYPKVDFSISEPVIPFDSGHWGNYIKAGVTGVIDHIAVEKLEFKNYSGFQAVISGNLPPASGLSSSSALVVATALAFIEVNHLNSFSLLEIAEICAKAERFVGTAGGGMDQAASLLGRAGHLLKLDFNPLRVLPVPFPDNLSILVFNTGIKAEKSGMLRKEYNQRVIECRIAMDLFKQFVTYLLTKNIQLIHYIGELIPVNTGLSDQMLINLVVKFYNSLNSFYRPIELANNLQLSFHSFKEKYFGCLEQEVFNDKGFLLNIKGRMKHVFFECRRVNDSVSALQKGDIAKFGFLMSESQKSLSENYEISTSTIDELCRRIVENGALGAKLTGAGFGGSIVAIAEKHKKDELIRRMNNDQYFKNMGQDFCISCIPSDGAGIICFEGLKTYS